MSLFQKIRFPPTVSYSSDSDYIPLEFYQQAFPVSKTVDMVLGYFSTNAIKILCISFAEFIFNGGKMRIVTNHILSAEDRLHLLVDPVLEQGDRIIDIFGDLKTLKEELGPYGQHFFDCMKYLMAEGRLEIIPVMHKPNATAHYKKVIFFDGENHMYINGSANFTYSGIIKNGESFVVERSWGDDIQKLRVSEEIKNFKKIFDRCHESYEYIDSDRVIGLVKEIGNDHSTLELLEKTKELLDDFDVSDKVKKIYKSAQRKFDDKIEELNQKPHFPYKEGPRQYQQDAYNNWTSNNKKGVFAMATGTGKTITSLNCLLNESKFSEENCYRALILVPTISLVEQWEEEAKRFNFQGIIKVSSKNSWESELASILSMAKRIPVSFIIVTTYASFVKDKFSRHIKNLPVDTLLIADEAHNIGAPSVLRRLHDFHLLKRIGLSATPKRVYDQEGSSEMESFFNDSAPYCYSFTMERAISEGILCKYYYHPHIVSLTNSELADYVEISKQLARMFNKETGGFNSPDIAERLLLKRKRIIHKAENKLDIMTAILVNRFKIDGHLQYTFIYVPEGSVEENIDLPAEERDELTDTQSIKIINQYTRAIGSISPNIRVNQFVSGMTDRDEILQQFKEGKIHVVASMKCLDEGIDIPRAEHAIFCSSTGNPRQFIQRRGRILRKHIDKHIAVIHDLVIVPDLSLSEPNSETFALERTMVRKELERVMDFASLAINPFETEKLFESICNHYDLNIYTIHKNVNAS